MRFRDIKTFVPKAAVISCRGSVSLDAKGFHSLAKFKLKFLL